MATLVGLALWRWDLALAMLLGGVVAGSVLAVARRPAPPEETGSPPVAATALPAALLESALDGLPDPHLVVEAFEADDLADRRIRFANRAAIETLKLEREGSPLVVGVREPRVLEAIDEALFGDISRVTDYETGGSRARHWRVWSAPLPAERGHRAVVRLRDETDSRRLEAMRVDFLANASHELRTPLAALAGFIETLRGHARDDEAARDRFLDIMAGQTDRMGRLVADLLSLSRIELNEHVPPTGQADLGMAVLDVVEATAQIAAERGVTLRLEPPRPPATIVIGDRDQLIQVFQNLVDNAVKYSPDGGEVLLTLASPADLDAALARGDAAMARMPLVTPERKAGTLYALVTVRDHGPGMAREHLPRLTERFYRVEGQKSGERSGTGLGLAIVKHIVNRHRGGLVVESRREAGATFSVFLPLAQEPTINPLRRQTVIEPS